MRGGGPAGPQGIRRGSFSKLLYLIFATAVVALLVLLHLPATAAGAGRYASGVLPAQAPECGLAWAVVSSADPGPGPNVLESVAVVSADDAWAVGYYTDSFGEVRTLTEHWNGSQWSAVPSPNVGSAENVLTGVAAISSNNVWAVGHFYVGGIIQTLALHWNGSQWNVSPTQNYANYDNHLLSVTAISANDIWSVGVICTASCFSSQSVQTLTEHWNGTQWSIVPSPTLSAISFLFGIDAVSTNDIWAVGEYGSCAGCALYTLIEHWDGTQWSVSTSPNAGGSTNYLYGVAALPTGNVWAVGEYYTGASWNTLTLYWNGTQWAIVPSANFAGTDNRLDAVDAISANDVWAVGDLSAQGQTLTEHWDGTAWAVVTSPNVGAADRLWGVAAESSTNVWSAGTGGNLTLVEHYNDPCATPSATPTSTGTATVTPTRTSTPTSTPTETATPCPMNFTDVSPADYFYTAVNYLYCHGVISGYGDGTFRPYNNTNRGQMAKIIVLAYGLPIYTPPTPTFSDVLPGSPFYQYVESAAHNNIVSGYSDGTFRPGNNVTRGQLCKIVDIAAWWSLIDPPAPTFSDVPTDNPFYTYIETAYCHGIISGYSDGTFRPGNNATRGQISKIVYEALVGGHACP